MSAADFFDTNVLLYLVSPDSAKADRVEALLAQRGTISIQVLDEFASVATRKFGKKLSEVREVLSLIRLVCEVKAANIETHDLGLDIAERCKFSVYDSMLLAAAIQARCSTFYTEDLQHGRKLEGLTIRNPFTS
ncbi:MAG TPA: PIN domain-containing protein [Rhizomicrobium sp.]